MGTFLGRIVTYVFLLILPFVFLIRTSVFLHVNDKLIPWACIAGGVLYTSILLFFYLTFFYGRLLGNDRPSVKNRFLVAFVLVILYSGHGIFYMSAKSFKSPELRQEISKVHPILRLSVSTLSHLDKNLIITDGDRLPEDYKKMGLPSKSHSLHYKQSSGYAHAIDLRTKGHGVIRNALMQGFFELMGFNTLRHGGTADHLHVSLLSHDRPGAR